ncbi:DNA-directed RNA polymerases I, II, and III subunit RPABC3 [Rhizophlyctis rosea]|nr:DNA-directed RNA polymerases I, II, and III subunit RPABC3 [Rhizophlyctis rosea]
MALADSRVHLFSDNFIVTDMNPDGKKFDRVCRILADGEESEILLTLDVNTEIYPMQNEERFQLFLASSLNTDEDVDMGGSGKREAWNSSLGAGTLADQYEYVMYGKVYSFDDEDTKASVYASYGGLLMCLAGPARHLQNLNVGQNLYLLIKKLPQA